MQFLFFLIYLYNIYHDFLYIIFHKFFSFFLFYPSSQSHFWIESLHSSLPLLSNSKFLIPKNSKKKNLLPENLFSLIYFVNLKKRRRMSDCGNIRLILQEWLQEEAVRWREQRQGEASFNEPPVFAYVSLAIFNCKWTATCF